MPQQEATAVWHDHWRMDITLVNGESEITAEARLQDGSAVVTGVGCVQVEGARAPDQLSAALAVRRSLEDVAESLGYLLDCENLAAIDEN